MTGIGKPVFYRFNTDQSAELVHHFSGTFPPHGSPADQEAAEGTWLSRRLTNCILALPSKY
jgi:hypothetical protein